MRAPYIWSADILEADNFLGACYRTAMTPKKLWTLPSPKRTETLVAPYRSEILLGTAGFLASSSFWGEEHNQKLCKFFFKRGIAREGFWDPKKGSSIFWALRQNLGIKTGPRETTLPRGRGPRQQTNFPGGSGPVKFYTLSCSLISTTGAKRYEILASLSLPSQKGVGHAKVSPTNVMSISSCATNLEKCQATEKSPPTKKKHRPWTACSTLSCQHPS